MASLEGFHPHVLRHTAATRLYEVTKGDIRTVQESLGHSDPKTTAIYTPSGRARLKEAVEQLDFHRPKKETIKNDLGSGAGA